METKNIFNLLGIIALIIIASSIGWFIFKFAMGIIAFLIFASGIAVGFGIAKLFLTTTKK